MDRRACAVVHPSANLAEQRRTASDRPASGQNHSVKNPFDWDLIRSFLAALEHGSLLGAARALHSSQPTIGRHIAELEAQLGVVLFERTGRGLLPSPAALRVAESARAMESAALQLARQLSAEQASVQGTVRITTSIPVACYLMPAVLARMRQQLPDVQVELVSSNQVSNLLRREADIALRMVRPEQSTLVARKIGDVGIGVFAHRSYLQRRGTPRTPNDLIGHDLIGGDQDDTILRGFESMGYPVPREAFSLRTDDPNAQWQAVCAGLGIGFAADYMGRMHPDVQRIVPGLKVPSLPMWLAVHREIRTNRRIRAVYDFLAQALPAAL